MTITMEEKELRIGTDFVDSVCGKYKWAGIVKLKSGKQYAYKSTVFHEVVQRLIEKESGNRVTEFTFQAC